MRKETLAPEILLTLLTYDPETGELFWKARPIELFSSKRGWAVWNARYAGKPAFTHLSHYGYFVGAIFDVSYAAHRVIWAMVTGAWPTQQIDHIDGNRTNNRFVNFREVSHTDNGKNQKMPFDNTSGVIGVHFHKQTQKWNAQIRIDGRCRSLGLYRKIEDAAAVRKAAEIAHGYHQNHGRAC